MKTAILEDRFCPLLQNKSHYTYPQPNLLPQRSQKPSTMHPQRQSNDPYSFGGQILQPPIKQTQQIQTTQRDSNIYETQLSEHDDQSYQALVKKVKTNQKSRTLQKLCVLLMIVGVIMWGVFVSVSLEYKDDMKEVILGFKVQEVQYYDLVKLNSTSARCLDGTPASYYESRTGDPSKILIFFEGGGWCGDATDSLTLQSCYQRSKTAMGSSKVRDASRNWTKGIMAREETDYFKDWKKIQFNYCDGSGHQGTRKQPIPYKDTKLYFRGHNNTVELFDQIEKRFGLYTKAQKVLIAGGSAGGLAAYMWTNYLADKVQKGKLYSAPDAGIFYDAINKKTKRYSYRESLANVMKLANAQIDPPVPECIKQFNDSKVDCMFAQNIFTHIKVPLFPVQSVYDAWSIPNILGLDCVQHGISTCSQEDRETLEDNRRNVTDILRRVGHFEVNGVFGLGCVKHGLLDDGAYELKKMTVPPYSKFTAGESLAHWMEHPDKDNIHIDYEPWPSNKPCA